MVFPSGTYWVSGHQLIALEVSDTHTAHIWKFSLHRGDSRITTHFQSDFKFNLSPAGDSVCSQAAVKQLPKKSGKRQQCDSTVPYTSEPSTSNTGAKRLQPNNFWLPHYSPDVAWLNSALPWGIREYSHLEQNSQKEGRQAPLLCWLNGTFQNERLTQSLLEKAWHWCLPGKDPSF